MLGSLEDCSCRKTQAILNRPLNVKNVKHVKARQIYHHSYLPLSFNKGLSFHILEIKTFTYLSTYKTFNNH
ncbi:hypothetical protein XELAEV_18006560mg [Xenopus laevis]|uniref:Uncharacterized protein n=1 Tax=Xenopus laevis TaxID=8355 RepID=A0A974E0D7_XENLA|nr:hypothetical protein XELAEV_18006560mg [Xenopus laevis]